MKGSNSYGKADCLWRRGPGTDDVKVTVKKGDKVVTGKYAGQELKLDGEDYVIVKMADILAVVE